MKYSVIVPVYNRPDEIDELLESMRRQTFTDFEVLIVEDGSSCPCDKVCEKYSNLLDIKYFMKPNGGPGDSRNYGAERALGEYLIILDSDVVVPHDYFYEVEQELNAAPADAFGGPDRAHPSFSDTQKAISYAMTAFFTTGGIRGGKKKLDKFYPRSFNMGVRRDVYLKLGGFSKMRFGEDIDFSIRIFKGGYSCRLFPKAWVWHKRRTDFRKFFRQVFNSGIARVNLYKKNPESLKLVHLLPTVFTLGVTLLCFLMIFGLILWSGPNNHFSSHSVGKYLFWGGLSPLVIYCLAILIDSSYRNESLRIGFLSIRAAFIQLFGYGLGFISAWYKRCLRGKGEFHAFDKTFYR